MTTVLMLSFRLLRMKITQHCASALKELLIVLRPYSFEDKIHESQFCIPQRVRITQIQGLRQGDMSFSVSYVSQTSIFRLYAMWLHAQSFTSQASKHALPYC